MIAFQIILPVLQALIFHFIYGGYPENIKIGVVNEEMPNLDTCSEVNNITCSNIDVLSCNFYNLLKPTFQLIPYNTIEEGRYAVTKNHIWALIDFPLNYTETLLARLQDHFFSEKIQVDYSQVNVWMDFSDFIIGNHIKDTLYTSFNTLFSDALVSCGWPNKASLLPISIKDPIYGRRSPSSTETVLGPYLALNTFYFPMAYSAGAILEEKTSKILKRSSVAGVRLTEVFSAVTAVQMVLLLLQLFSTWYTYVFIFGIECKGDVYLVWFFLYVQGLAGITCGLFLTTVCNSMTLATHLGMFVTAVAFYFGGIIWPKEGLHPLLSFFQFVSPVNYLAEAVSSVMFKAWTFTNMIVLKGFFLGVLWMLFFILGVIALSNLNPDLLM